jgi:integrase
MPAIQRGQAYKLGVGKWGLRYYDENGVRRRKSAFPSKSAALAHYRDFIEPRLLGEPEPPEPEPERTFGEFVPVYLDRHAATVRPRTVETLRKRLGHRRKLEDGETCRCATCAFGDVPLRDLERMSGEIASWQAKLPKRSRYGTIYRPLPAFAAASGLRPEEWAVLERRDVDRRGAALRVRRTISAGEIVELAKTSRSRREVPLSDRALAALEELSPRLDSPYLFAARRGGPFDLANFRRREWAPAIEASGVARPARLYDLRSTFASNSLAAGVTVFELARLMGTSVAMIERHYGTLLEGAGADIARRLSAFEAEQGRARDRATDAHP